MSKARYIESTPDGANRSLAMVPDSESVGLRAMTEEKCAMCGADITGPDVEDNSAVCPDCFDEFGKAELAARERWRKETADAANSKPSMVPDAESVDPWRE